MTHDTATRVQSRPKLIALDLRSVGVTESLAELPPQEFVDTLFNDAIRTGLPTIMIAGADDIMPSDMEDVFPPHVTCVRDLKSALNCLSTIGNIGPIPADFSRQARDVLWISNHDGPPRVIEDARHCPMQNATQLLRKLCHQYRYSGLRGTPAEAEMAYTVLMPLDLELGSIADPHQILSHGRLVFDVVLMVEGQVAMAGFKVKALEKLIAGFAPIIYSMDDEFCDGAEELRTTLSRLHEGGARHVIGVCNGQKDHEARHPFEDHVRNAGLTWRRITWNDLV
ncbi:hypothetical protein [Tateyamaria omphalii]|uniref:Uncharacterized protein n=1 Tax=Tateyamaria omphalii TaxID=299262 RepID=A0A1P8MWW5_9RHOB|nr:hypothetical protein [Tateyamaria omphalii]APX12419.1 hypothetical protein BWR18_12585 [Tateyamaria omphalii]